MNATHFVSNTEHTILNFNNIYQLNGNPSVFIQGKAQSDKQIDKWQIDGQTEFQNYYIGRS